HRAFARALAVYEDRSVAGATDLPLKPHHAEVVGGPDHAAGGVLAVPGLNVEKAHVPAAHLSAQAPSGQDVDGQTGGGKAHPPGEEQVDVLRVAKLERRRVLEEEGPLLREEKVKAGEVYLLLIRFHLGEVGVDGRVQGQVRPNAPLEIEADVGLLVNAGS